MTLVSENGTSANTPNKPTTYPDRALPNGQMPLFEVPRDLYRKLSFPVRAVVDFRIEGYPTDSIPETPVSEVVLYGSDGEPILRVEPLKVDTEMIAHFGGFMAHMRVLQGSIDTRWTERHAEHPEPEAFPLWKETV